MSYFETKIEYQKECNGGKAKNANDVYLIEAESFTEAEAKANEIMENFKTPFKVESIKKIRLAELFIKPGEDLKFYIAKVGFISLDEKAGVEKMKSVNMLIKSSEFEEALEDLKVGMSDSITDYVIQMIKETPIIDIYK